MSAAKQVLLARPHSFIVSDMRPFLEKCGFSPVRLDALATLDSGIPGISGAMSGAVISTAVVSTINASAEEVFGALRKKYPRLPVIFAGLTEFPMMKSAVERVVGRLHPGAEVLPFSSASENHPGLGRENVFLVLRKEDMAPGSAAETAERILRKHFR